jgi:hypothetical protein
VKSSYKPPSRGQDCELIIKKLVGCLKCALAMVKYVDEKRRCREILQFYMLSTIKICASSARRSSLLALGCLVKVILLNFQTCV